MSESPRITIAIPTLNQAEFIEQALDSVLSQNYPNLNLMVFDGASSDGTQAVLERYRRHLTYYRSCPDEGPWPTILEAAECASEGWFNWLNSDDYLLSGALSSLAELAMLQPQCQWISGARLDVDIDGRAMRVSCPWLMDPTEIAFGQPFLPQDATFFRLHFFRRASQAVPQGLNNIFDTVLHRVAWQLDRPLLTDHVFSAMRWHESQLTANSQRRIQELSRPDVQAIMPRRPLTQRILKRLAGSRLRNETSALIRALMGRGWAGTCNLQACVYSPFDRHVRQCTVADLFAE